MTLVPVSVPEMTAEKRRVSVYSDLTKTWGSLPWQAGEQHRDFHTLDKLTGRRRGRLPATVPTCPDLSVVAPAALTPFSRTGKHVTVKDQHVPFCHAPGRTDLG